MYKKLAGAVTAALIVGGFVGVQIGSTASSSPPSVFTPTVPCRLLDTRPDTRVNSFDTLGPKQTRNVSTWGANGQCDLPTGTTGIALNVTSVNHTQPSFLTLWPSDAARPGTSNLNWIPPQAPTPNKVDIALSSNGRFTMYNENGSVDVIVDVLGYYTPLAEVTPSVGTVTVVTAEIDVEPTTTPDDTGSNGQAIAMCPSGQVAIGGGVNVENSVPLNMRSSRPHPKNATTNPTGWFGDVRAPDDRSDQTATVYALCVTQ